MSVSVDGLENHRELCFQVVQDGILRRLMILGGTARLHLQVQAQGPLVRHVELDIRPGLNLGGVEAVLVSVWPASLGHFEHQGMCLWSVGVVGNRWLEDEGVLRVVVELTLEGQGSLLQRVGYLIHLVADGEK